MSVAADIRVTGVKGWQSRIEMALTLMNAANKRYGEGAISYVLEREYVIAAMLAHLGIEELKPETALDGFAANLAEQGVKSVLEVGGGYNPFVLLFPQTIKYYALEALPPEQLFYLGLLPEDKKSCRE
jgi:hypothetical protein